MRVSKPPEERRAELVAAARQLFDEKGVDKTRVSDIVRRVGVAQGVFYYYFSSKEEMVQTVAGMVAGEMDQKAKAILTGPGEYYQKLAGFIELYIDLVDKFLGDDETSLGPLAQNGMPLGGPGGAMAEKLYTNLQLLVQQGVQQGRFATPYPRESMQVAIYGLLALAGQKLPSRRMIYTIVEQAMGVPKGALTQYIQKSAQENKGMGV